MNFKQMAENALAERARLIGELRSVTEDSSLTDADKQVRSERLTTDIAAKLAEAEGYVQQGEREAETRSLFEKAGFSLGGPETTATYRSAGHWLQDAIQAEYRSLTGASGVGAAFTPQESSQFFFDRLRAQSVFLQSGVKRIQTDRDTLVVPRLLTGATVDWTAEAAALTTGDATADTVTFTPRKLSHIVSLSSEVEMDANPSILEAYSADLIKGLALRFDVQAFEGSGTAPAIRGIKNMTGINNQSMGTNGLTPTNFDFIADALLSIEAANGTPSAIVLHPRTWNTLRKIKQTSGGNLPVLMESQGSVSQAIRGEIYGVPVYVSSQLSVTETQGTANNASSCYVYDSSQLVVCERYAPVVQRSAEALFATDQIQYRGLYRVDVQAAQPSAVVRIAGLLP